MHIAKHAFLFVFLTLTAESALAGNWEQRRAKLNLSYQQNEFRIFYTFNGKDAVPVKLRTDRNRNQIPDLVEDIMTQLLVANTIYVASMKLRHPLKSPRYKDRVKFIDINLLKFPLTKGGPKRGIAYDGIISFQRKIDGKRPIKSLAIDLSNSINTGNITPAHELFHLYQNGYTLFKNRWYTEGTARWAEHAIKSGTGAVGTLPATQSQLQKLFRSSYDAAGFWNSLAFSADTREPLRIPNKTLQTRYVLIDKKVIKGSNLYGVRFIRVFLENLDKLDDEASVERGLDKLYWKEKVQKSRSNNVYIWRAVLNALRACCSKPKARALADKLSHLKVENAI